MAASSGLSAAALSTHPRLEQTFLPPPLCLPRARQISVAGLWGKHGRGPLVPRVSRRLHLPGLPPSRELDLHQLAPDSTATGSSGARPSLLRWIKYIGSTQFAKLDLC